MAIDLTSTESLSRLATAVRRSYELDNPGRRRRQNLIDIYADRGKLADVFLQTDSADSQAYLNLFALFVRGHLITLAHNPPKWSVNARSFEGIGFDKRMQHFLNKYADFLRFQELLEQLALDSCFGRAVVKVISALAPKGVSAPVAPRAYRLNPDRFIPDRSAASHQEMTYCGDIYFADLDDARAHPFFDPVRRMELQEWSAGGGGGGSGSAAFRHPGGDHDLFASPQTRLIDLYFPTLGLLATWPCPNDTFADISSQPPIGVMRPKCNPYVCLDLLAVPDDLEVISRLGQLRPLNMLSNDLFGKAARQTRQSKRNPVGSLGDEADMDTALSTRDGEPILLTNPESLDLYTLPAADSGVVGMAMAASQLFSQHAGNLETALGVDPGAGTARQTQALIGQISQGQAFDRNKWESFLTEIGKRLATLAFYDEQFAFNMLYEVPGTRYSVNASWQPPHLMDRVAEVDDYSFEVVKYSTARRGPEERIAQLDAASKLALQFLQFQANGAPIDMESVLRDMGEAFDLIPSLAEWWSGQPPTPQEAAGNVYRSLSPAGGGGPSTTQYLGVGNGAGPLQAGQASPGGLSSGSPGA